MRAGLAPDADAPSDAEPVMPPPSASEDEELWIARGVLALLEVDETARKAAKAGGAQWTPELRERARAVRAALLASPETRDVSEKPCAVESTGNSSESAGAP